MRCPKCGSLEIVKNGKCLMAGGSGVRVKKCGSLETVKNSKRTMKRRFLMKLELNVVVLRLQRTARGLYDLGAWIVTAAVRYRSTGADSAAQ